MAVYRFPRTHGKKKNQPSLKLSRPFVRIEKPLMFWARVFLIMALIAGIFGISGIESTATDVAFLLFAVFVVLLIIYFILEKKVSGL